MAEPPDLRVLPPVDEEPEPEHDSWWPINLAGLDEKPPLEPTLGTTGLVYPGKRHVLSGPQESAKTLAAYAIGITVVRAGGRILLLDFEMGAYDARNRLRDLGATPDEVGRFLYVEPGTPATVEKIDPLIERSPTLVIIDAAAGAYDLQSLDDNKRGDVEKFTRLYVTRFWRAGIATIVLDHVVKNSETRGSYAIGSERKVGGADVHLGFEVVTPIKRGSRGLYKITTHKDRGGYLKRGKLAELELSSDPDTHQIDWAIRLTVAGESEDEHGHFRPTHLMEKVSKHLEGQSEAVSRRSVVDALGGKAEYVRTAIDLLISEGYASESSGPNRTKLTTSAKPFREETDAIKRSENLPSRNENEHKDIPF